MKKIAMQGPLIEQWNPYMDTSQSGTDSVLSIHCPFWPATASGGNRVTEGLHGPPRVIPSQSLTSDSISPSWSSTLGQDHDGMEDIVFCCRP